MVVFCGILRSEAFRSHVNHNATEEKRMGYVPDRLREPIAPRVEEVDVSAMKGTEREALAGVYYSELTMAWKGLAEWISDYQMQFAPIRQSGRHEHVPFEAQKQPALPLALSRNTTPARMLFMTATGLHISPVVTMPGRQAVYPEWHLDADKRHAYEHSNGALLLQHGPSAARMLDVFRKYVVGLYKIRPAQPNEVQPQDGIARAPSLASIPPIIRDARFYMIMNGYYRAVYPNSSQPDFPFRAGMASRGWNVTQIHDVFVELTGLGMRLGRIALPGGPESHTEPTDMSQAS